LELDIYYKCLVSTVEGNLLLFYFGLTFPFFSQVICGSGSPVTLQLSSNDCPSLTEVSSKRVEKSGGHMASSGDTKKL